MNSDASLDVSVVPAPRPAAASSRFGKKRLALGGMLILALTASAIYLFMGRQPEATSATTPSTSQPSPPSQATQGKPAHALSDEQLQRMVEQATAQAKKNPEDAAAWAMVAHSYDMLGKFAESSKAYATLARLVPKDAQVLADYADALAVANGRTLHGEPAALVKKALAIDGKNLKALVLAGTAALENKNYGEAVNYWERALAVSTDAAFRHQIEGSIADAKAASRGETTGERDAAAGSATPSSASVADAVVSGRVSLADELVAKASPDATVFIFARPVKGSRMPVALLRKRVRDLPIDFTLDDSIAMVPDAKLSQVSTVVIGARISKRGDVAPQPGDMQGWSAPVRVGTKGIKLEISEVLK